MHTRTTAVTAWLTFGLLLSHGVLAQIAPLPSSGSQILQIPPPTLPQPRSIPEIRIQKSGAPALPGADSVRFSVRSIRVTGQTLYPESELIAASGFTPGERSLAELRAMATKIAEHYNRNGYFVAQAYLPAQDIKDGAVTIQVLEGRYGKIDVRNSSRLADARISSLLSGLNSGDVIAIGPLESRLLLLSDIPGVNVKSTLAPGGAVGTSDLIVEVAPGRTFQGSVEADNHGNRYTGQYRVGATLYWNNPLGLGDQASVRVLTSGKGLTYGRAAYQVPVGRATFGAAYTALEYRLLREFAPLQAHGTAQIGSLWGSYALIRSRATNLYALVGFDARKYQDKIDSTVPPTVTDKKNHVWMGSLYGNHRDGLGAGGVTSFSLTYSAGDLDIQTPAALAADALGARTNGNYGKLAYSLSRVQNITDSFSLYGAINGQVASKNLDISEKMGLGGPYAVRAYPVGEGYGDEGYVINLEARQRLPKFWNSQPGSMYLIGFIDAGHVKLNKNPFAVGQNERSLSGAGFGMNWIDHDNFSLSWYYAHRISNELATSAPDTKGRVWVQGIKFF
jgi:hemolysin activation/secretion protein